MDDVDQLLLSQLTQFSSKSPFEDISAHHMHDLGQNHVQVLNWDGGFYVLRADMKLFSFQQETKIDCVRVATKGKTMQNKPLFIL